MERTARIINIITILFILSLPAHTQAQALSEEEKAYIQQIQSDQENCLFCHKYSGMGRYEKKLDSFGRKRVFYINADLFRQTAHGKLRCKDCHAGVDRIPHTDVEKVDCSRNCHIQDPSSGKDFSHKKIVEDLKRSVHGPEGARYPKYKRDLPTCLDCHNNPIINVSSGQHLPFLNVCTQCHQKKDWATRFLKHQFYRMGKRRSSKEIVALCSSCHENPKMMRRHRLDVVVGFKDTYHGKAINYGNEEVANCLNCHAPRGLGLSPHNILTKRDPRSSVHPRNRLRTCQDQGGVAECHPSATERFALGRKSIHGSGSEEFLRAALYSTGGARMQRGSPSSAGDDTKTDDPKTEEDIFHFKVVYWINTGYKIAIAIIVGGMVVHQTLDFWAVARERRREREDDQEEEEEEDA